MDALFLAQQDPEHRPFEVSISKAIVETVIERFVPEQADLGDEDDDDDGDPLPAASMGSTRARVWGMFKAYSSTGQIINDNSNEATDHYRARLPSRYLLEAVASHVGDGLSFTQTAKVLRTSMDMNGLPPSCACDRHIVSDIVRMICMINLQNICDAMQHRLVLLQVLCAC